MKIRLSKTLAGSYLALIFAGAGQSAFAAGPHYVFAHYMVCYATYGETIQGYGREIREAQAAGIDGFALNVGAWSGPDTYYKSRVQLLYQAAELLGTNFKFFFSVDMGDTNDIVDMISTYAARTNTFRYENKVVVSTFGQNDLDWINSIFTPLKNRGISVFFIPHFWPDPVTELPAYRGAVGILNVCSNLLDGLFLFGAAGLPYQLAQCNSNYAAAVHAAGKVFMASYTAHYWGNSQTSSGRRYFESDGGEGTILQWNAIIASQPDWVEIVTWNDFNESTYLSPVDNPEQYEGQVVSPHRYSHAGFLELSKRYIAWYKTGMPPAINNDVLFYFYRTHSMNLMAADTNDIPVTWRIGDLADVIYITVILTATAQLNIVSGTNSATYSLPAGLQQLRTPFAAGSQTFTLTRSGTQVLSVQGPPILSQIANYDFFPTSGCTYSSTNSLNPPNNLKTN
jgi:glucan endo-1,3-alpha-glucosidase